MPVNSPLRRCSIDWDCETVRHGTLFETIPNFNATLLFITQVPTVCQPFDTIYANAHDTLDL